MFAAATKRSTRADCNAPVSVACKPVVNETPTTSTGSKSLAGSNVNVDVDAPLYPPERLAVKPPCTTKVVFVAAFMF